MDLTVTIVMLVPVILAVALIVNVVRKNITEREPGASVDITGAIPAVIVLLVAVMIIGSMGSSIDNEFELYECEPLSTFGSGAVIEGDCVETVTIGDTEYVRMTDLGTFTATSGDSTKEYTVTKAKMDLVLFAGQSNVVRGTSPVNYSGSATVLPGQAFYLGHEPDPTDTEFGGQIMAGSVTGSTVLDILDDSGDMRLAGMYPSFCGDYVTETGHRLITVSAAIGNKSIAEWDDGASVDLLTTWALELLVEESEGKIDLNPVGVLWVQGEADTTNTEAYYLEKFGQLLEKFEDGYYAGIEFPHVTSSLPRTGMRSIDNMIPPALAQIEEASLNADFTVATYIAYRATQEQMRDSVHFTQEYYGWVGEAFARELAKLTGYRPVPETLVLTEDVGTVSALPSKIEAYGTSGEAYEISVSWTETGVSGVYASSITRIPSGMDAAEDLSARATTRIYNFSSDKGELQIIADIATTDEKPWNDYAGSVKSLVIVEGVDSISSNAFTSLTSLEYLEIPESLTLSSSALGVSVEDYQGQSITSLSPGEYLGPGDGTIYYADSSIFQYDSTGTHIYSLKSDVTSAKAIVIPSTNNGVEISTIQAHAFRANADAEFGGTVPGNKIASLEGIFRECTSLTAASFKGEATTVKLLVMDCTSLASVELPSTLVNLDMSSFWGCSSLQTIDFPDSMTAIGNNAFYNCTSLASVELGDSIESIGDNVFKNCTGVTTVTFGSGFSATLGTDWAYSWTFYDTDGTTELDKTVASNLAGFTFTGTASALVKQV